MRGGGGGMRNSDILIGDVVLAKIKDVGELEIVAIAPPRHDYKNGPMLFLIPKDASYGLKFIIDEDYLEDTPEIPRKYLGWYVARIWPQEIIRLVNRPKNIGDNVNVSCLIYDDKINKICKPNSSGSVLHNLEIIGVRFNKSFWEYEYSVKLPPDSPAGIVLQEDLNIWGIENDKFVGSLFTLVLKSEIVVSQTAPYKIGMNCMNKYCREFCPLVDSPNCPNDIFLCYRCRTNPMTYIIVVEGCGK